jgi:5'-3' exoribonuclease 1
MGIPYYFSYLIKNHSLIISKLEFLNNNIHNLFLDCNSLIYDSLHFKNFQTTSQFESYIIESVIVKIEEIIKAINPSETIYIAFDGVPPYAKISQQKNRRYKSAYQSALFKTDVLWDSCAITPGTNFMNSLNNALISHFKYHNYYNSINKPLNLNVILSLSNEAGEGEHKLFQYIRQSNNIANKNSVIYGMDADLIMLSLSHLKYTQHIYLYRETPVFINSLDKSLSENEKYIININLLGNIIYKEITNDIIMESDTPEWLKNAQFTMDISFNKIHSAGFYNKIEDYIFICFLLGNDFLPHFPALNIRLNGFTILLECYKKMFGATDFLVANNAINWHNFKKYIKAIAEHEEKFIKEVYSVREKQGHKFYPENNEEEKMFKFSCMPSWERNIEVFINPFEEDWTHRYYYSLLSINSNKSDYKKNIENLCLNYMETLQWVYSYYTSSCKNWTIHFKYNYPPLLSDLYSYIPYFNSEFVIVENNDILNDKLLLCHVLPKKSLCLLPDKIHNYLLKNYEHLYKEDYSIVYAFCKYFYEGHVIFPEFNIDEFNNAIKKLL